MSVSAPQRWDWLPAQRSHLCETSHHPRPGAPGTDSVWQRPLHSHRAALRLQPPGIPHALSGTAARTRMYHAAVPLLKNRRGGAPYPSLLVCYLCSEPSTAQQGQPLAVEQNDLAIQAPPPAPSHGQMASAIWVLFYAETLVPQEHPAMQGM